MRIKQEISPWYALPANAQSIKSVSIIGAGLAGMSLAYHLTMQGIEVQIFEAGANLPQGASQNQFALVKPQLSPDNNLPDQYFTQAFLYFLDFIAAYPHLKLSSGILELSHSDKMRLRHLGILKRNDLPLKAQYLDAASASLKAGIALDAAALYFTDAFILDVQNYYQLLLQLCDTRVKIISDYRVIQLEHHERWIINHEYYSDAVIFAHGHQNFSPWIDVSTLIPCPGQLSFIKPQQILPLRCTLSFEGYLTPSFHGQHILGASFRHEENLEIRDDDHQQNLAYLQTVAPEAYIELAPAPWRAWCAMRTTSLDHLPLVGAVPIKSEWLRVYERVKFGDFRTRQYPDCPYYPNLFMSLAHGSKGVISTFYAAKILSDLIMDNSLSIQSQVYQAIHPARFWLRNLKRSR